MATSFDEHSEPLTPTQRAALIGLIIVVICAFLPAWSVGMGGDDLNWFFGAVRAQSDPSTLFEVQQNFFRPSEQIYFWILLRAVGAWFPGYLAAAVVIHLFNVFLLWRLARELTQEFWSATIGTGWWAVHHLHVEPVVRPYGIADPLALLGSLLAFDLARRGRPLLAVLPFAVAMGAKENAIVVPVVIWLWALMEPVRPPHAWWIRTTPMGLLVAGSGIMIAFQRTASTSYLEVDPLAAASTFWENVLSWFGPDIHYIRYVVLGRADPIVPWWLAIALAVVVLILLARASWQWRIASVWTVVLMAPTIFVPLQPARYQYVPMIGAALLVALTVRGAVRTRHSSRIPLLFLGLFLTTQTIWNLVGIQLEASDFRTSGELHRRAAESFRLDVLPTMTARPENVAVFLRSHDLIGIVDLRRVWDTHSWWAPTSHKIVFRRPAGPLGLSNTWAFVTWAGYGLAPDPLFVVASPVEAIAAAKNGRLIAVEHLGMENLFSLRNVEGMPPAESLFTDPDVWWSLQPGRFSPDGSGTQYPDYAAFSPVGEYEVSPITP